MRRLRPLLLVLTLAVVAAACSGDDTDPDAGAGPGEDPTTTSAPSTTTGPTITPVVGGGGVPAFGVRLQTFDSCDALLDQLTTLALDHVTPWGLGQGGWWGGPMPLDVAEGDMAAAEDGGDGGAESAAPTTTAPLDHSTTNVQVAGIDEPDVLKTDGRYAYAVADSWLHVASVGDSPELVGRVDLGPGWNHQLLLGDERVWVMSSGDDLAVVAEQAGVADQVIVPPYAPTTRVVEIDLSDPTDPTIVAELHVEGALLSARQTDSIARLVVTGFPSRLPFVTPSSPAAEDLALETNRRVIQEASIEDWLPQFVLERPGGEATTGTVGGCDHTSLPSVFSGFGTTSVVSLDVDTSLTELPEAATLFAPATTIYADIDSLYVATTSWVDPEVLADDQLEEVEDRYATSIHEFSLDGESIAYEASGEVPGHLLNQFALDEYEGVLRVATTLGSPWGGDSESVVTTLRRDGDTLARIGQVGDMGRGEQIFSVRFVGDVAYVVTFRQTDPFYTVDLADPAAPQVLGELKITGYSGYLHPVGEHLVLGVGQDATEDGRIQGTKVALFDVTDLAAPRELDTWTYEGQSSSDTEWDHRAFLHWAPEGLVVMPLTSWDTGFAGAIALRIADGTLEPAGEIVHGEGGGDGLPPGCQDLGVGSEVREQTGEPIIVAECGTDDWVESARWYCEPVPVDSLEDWYGIDPGVLNVDPAGTVHVCWPSGGFEHEPISRLAVIGDDLWSLSRVALQTNDLVTLERDAVLSF